MDNFKYKYLKYKKKYEKLKQTGGTIVITEESTEKLIPLEDLRWDTSAPTAPIPADYEPPSTTGNWHFGYPEHHVPSRQANEAQANFLNAYKDLWELFFGDLWLNQHGFRLRKYREREEEHYLFEISLDTLNFYYHYFKKLPTGFEQFFKDIDNCILDNNNKAILKYVIIAKLQELNTFMDDDKTAACTRNAELPAQAIAEIGNKDYSKLLNKYNLDESCAGELGQLYAKLIMRNKSSLEYTLKGLRETLKKSLEQNPINLNNDTLNQQIIHLKNNPGALAKVVEQVKNTCNLSRQDRSTKMYLCLDKFVEESVVTFSPEENDPSGTQQGSITFSNISDLEEVARVQNLILEINKSLSLKQINIILKTDYNSKSDIFKNIFVNDLQNASFGLPNFFTGDIVWYYEKNNIGMPAGQIRVNTTLVNRGMEGIGWEYSMVSAPNVSTVLNEGYLLKSSVLNKPKYKNNSIVKFRDHIWQVIGVTFQDGKFKYQLKNDQNRQTWEDEASLVLQPVNSLQAAEEASWSQVQTRNVQANKYWCSKCRKNLPKKEFSNNQQWNMNHGQDGWCKECIKKWRR
jgi:hypothetical protein